MTIKINPKEKPMNKKILNLPNIKTAGTTYTDEQICSYLNIEIPSVIPDNRALATKILGNFQLRKAYAVNKANKLLRHMNVQLAQKSHTGYEVISLEAKKANLAKRVVTLQKAVASF